MSSERVKLTSTLHDEYARIKTDVTRLQDEAAHVPVIWATQVLESLANQGLPR